MNYDSITTEINKAERVDVNTALLKLILDELVKLNAK